jgi:hypothetical protein
MKPEGSLAEHDFPSLVQALHQRRWTGLLTLSHAGVGKSVTVQEGRMVFASSSSPDDRLGELLLRRGKISLQQLEASSKEVGPGKRLGAALVEAGVLPPKELVRAVVEHTQEIIYSAFLLTEGHYRVQEGPPSKEVIKLNMSTPDLILEGIRRIDAWSRIQAATGGTSARYERADDYEDVIPQMSLSLEKLGILTALHESRTVGEICADSSLPDFEVCRTLWAFRVVGVVRRLDKAAPRAAALDVEDEGLGFVVPE